MHINPYGEDPVILACDLMNDPPMTLKELVSRCAQAGLAISGRPTKQDFIDVTAFFGDWLDVVDATDETDRAERLNTLLAHHAEHPRLTNHAGDGWHLHYRGPRALGGQLAVIISVGTATHLTARGMHRLARCGASDCDRVFADTSRNGRQTYCSSRCGSRSAVRRHRGRG